MNNNMDNEAETGCIQGCKVGCKWDSVTPSSEMRTLIDSYETRGPHYTSCGSMCVQVLGAAGLLVLKGLWKWECRIEGNCIGIAIRMNSPTLPYRQVSSAQSPELIPSTDYSNLLAPFIKVVFKIMVPAWVP